MSEYLRSLVSRDHFKQPWDQVKFRSHFGVCIYDTLIRRGYQRTEEEDWNVFWSEKELINSVFEKCRMQPHQRVNHFRNYYELCRKDNLSRNLKRFKKQLEKDGKTAQAKTYNFFPTTYHLPIEYGIFADEFKKATDKNIWIMKPTAKSQGNGIFLFNKFNAISAWSQSQAEPYIVQKYISDPLLIGGKKFDLRLYVLCTSYHPLNVYLYRSGFARFTHYRYDQSKISSTEIHLTNVAIQKMTEEYNPELGGKWLVDKLRLYLLSKYGAGPVEECFYNIQTLIIKTLKSVQKLMPNDKHCFELYGFDIMLDASLKPWIIEVNGSPSMRANTPTDCKLKCGLIDDVLSIVDVEGLLTGKEDQVGGFDLIFQNDVEKISPLGPGTSRLGCLNDRLDAMKKLARRVEGRLLKQKQNARLVINSTDEKGKKIDQKRQTSTIPRINQRPSSIARPMAKQSIQQTREPVKVQNKDAKSMGQSSSNANAQNKNWIIRKSNSIRKQPLQPAKRQPIQNGVAHLVPQP